MKRLFIIEGPDCSGKTTLAKRIAMMRNAMYIHATGSGKLFAAMLDYHLSIVKNASINLSNGHDVVLDRLWPSEYVYGQILRPTLSNNSYDFVPVLKALAPLKPTYVFCNDELVQQRHVAERDNGHPYSDTIFNLIVGAYGELEDEMRQQDPLPLFQPGTECSNFDIKSYSILEHGSKMADFVESL